MDDELKIKEAAREWLLRFALEAPTDAERAEFADWMTRDPRHAAAYRRFESIWDDAARLQELQPLLAAVAGPDAARRADLSRTSRRAGWAIAAGFAVAVAGLATWLMMRPDSYVTGVAEIREIHLPDGTDVTLGAKSSLEVGFERRERRVSLISGVAFFSVSKNPSRPFIVSVGNREVRVVGTQFEVRRSDGGMRVSVVEGTVKVMQRADSVEAPFKTGAPATQSPSQSMGVPVPVVPRNDRSLSAPETGRPVEERQEQILFAGQQVTAAPGAGIPAPLPMPHGEAAAWRQGRLVYVDAPLEEIIADANRYSPEQIAVVGADAAQLRVSVTYPSSQIGEMLTALSRSLSLDIERRDHRIVLKARERGE